MEKNLAVLKKTKQKSREKTKLTRRPLLFSGRRWEVDLTSEISEDEEDLITRLYKLLGESQVGSDSWEATLEDQGAGRIILEGQNWERTSRATAHLQPRMILPSRGRCRLYESCYAIPLY
ncbi:uncharacterized protein LOC18445161 isoform X2 [Amborella trichopoda]|uniref:uncharacterized protein LOC18445161 isoform X2 n=1 Tax=Amborella trichopoda TaxID=13333 RepID=UPI0009BF6E2D|nr:uncharacterized protein LOC18445161 isoform X2 [Amborella trichopoda]|eukprot:XP_020529723.1 uncharacterized protein LOC18445161 isoform X2 [Amborella trichopoda]